MRLDRVGGEMLDVTKDANPDRSAWGARLFLKPRRPADGAPPSPAMRVAAAARSVVILLAVTLVYLVVGEAAIRLATGTSLTDTRDFRSQRAQRNPFNDAIEYDPLLGWRLKPLMAAGWLNTLEFGLRSNGPGNTHARRGGILAVGSSFTAGSEVKDEESWPAHLERLTG